jgi:hypothetical protein
VSLFAQFRVGRGAAVVGLACAALCSATASASAAEIAGNPLRIFMDGYGRLQVQFADATTGELAPADEQLAQSSGMTFDLYTADGDSGSACGPYGNPVMPVSGPTAVTGDGSAADPFELSTTYTCQAFASELDITQTFDYVNGDAAFVASYVVTNPGAAPVAFRAISHGDFSGGGSGAGVGFVDEQSPRAVGFFNDAEGSDGGFDELSSTPWSSFYEAGPIPTATFPPEDELFGPGLPDTVDQTLEANPRVGVAFDQYRSFGLAPAASASFDVGWFFDRYDGLALSPATDTKTAGGTELVTATSLDRGVPVDGGVVRYTVAGANPSSGVVQTGADGTATISWTGAKAGTDTLTAFLDADDTGTFDPDNDTQATTTVSWTAAPAPAPTPAPPVSTPPPPAAPTPTPAGPALAKAKPKAVVHCVVPSLKGRTTAAARRLLDTAHCALGTVAKPGHARGSLVVASQQPAAASVHAAGAKVRIRLKVAPARR